MKNNAELFFNFPLMAADNPFVDLSSQKDQEYFCDGLAEELINKLSNIENLRVLARASALQINVML